MQAREPVASGAPSSSPKFAIRVKVAVCSRGVFDRSTLKEVSWPYGRHPGPRPTATDGAKALRGGERGPLGATAGPVHCSCRRHPSTLGSVVHDAWSPWATAVADARESTEATVKVEPMTNINSDELQRRRDELSRDRVGCRPTPATGARRRLGPIRAGATRNSTSSHGPRDPASTTSRIPTDSPGFVDNKRRR